MLHAPSSCREARGSSVAMQLLCLSLVQKQELGLFISAGCVPWGGWHVGIVFLAASISGGSGHLWDGSWALGWRPCLSRVRHTAALPLCHGRVGLDLLAQASCPPLDPLLSWSWGALAPFLPSLQKVGEWRSIIISSMFRTEHRNASVFWPRLYLTEGRAFWQYCSDLAVNCSHLATNEHLGLCSWGLQRSPIYSLDCTLGKSHHGRRK